MGTESVRLDYDVTVSGDLRNTLPERCHSALDRFAVSSGKQAVSVTLSDAEIAFDYGNKTTLRIDLNTGARLFIDHERKEYLTIEQGPKVLELLERTSRGFKGKRIGNRRVVNVAKQRLLTQRYDFLAEGLAVEMWLTTQLKTPPFATRVLSRLMAPISDASEGLPTEILVRDPERPSATAVHVRLVAYENVPDERARSSKPPDGYKSLDQRPVIVSSEKIRRRRETKGHTSATTGPMRTERLGELVDYRHRAAIVQGILGGTEDDCAWITLEVLLDQVKDAFNAIAGAFGTFRGDGQGGSEAMHVVVDWWAHLANHFNFANNMAVEGYLRKLWLAYKVMQGENLDGLTESQRAKYDAIVQGTSINEDIRNLYGLEAARYLAFLNAFSSPEIIGLEWSQFNRLTKPIRLDFGVKEFETDLYFGVCDLSLRAWDFDTEISLERPLVDELKFSTGLVDLTLRLKQFRVDFQFSTEPIPTLVTGIFHVVTLGASSAFCTNYGWGYFNIDNARIALRINASQTDSATVLTGSILADRSGMDSSVFFVGVNLFQDVFDALFGAFLSWTDWLNGRILDTIGQHFNEAVGGIPFRWPAIWNATAGPLVASTGVKGSGRAFRATLENPPKDVSGPITGVDFARVLPAPFGYAVSARYLTAWLRKIIGEFAEDRFVDADWQREFGVALPDLSTFQLPAEALAPSGPSAFDTASEVGRSYRTRIVRRAPVVVFPESGQVQRAGQAQMAIEVRLEAVAGIFHKRYLGTQPGRTRWIDAGRIPSYGPPIDLPGLPASMFGLPAFQPGEPTGGALFNEPSQDLWATWYTDYVLETLVRGSCRVTGDLLLGFHKAGNPWLPEIRISLREQNGDPVLHREVLSLETRGPFDGVPRDRLEQFILTLFAPDPAAILSRATFMADRAPASVRRLVPDAAALLGTESYPVPQDLLDMVIYRQVTGGDSPVLTYTVEGGWLYWPIRIVENLSNHIS